MEIAMTNEQKIKRLKARCNFMEIWIINYPEKKIEYLNVQHDFLENWIIERMKEKFGWSKTRAKEYIRSQCEKFLNTKFSYPIKKSDI